MTYLVGVSAFALVIGVAMTCYWASGQRWRWGWRIARRVEVGEGVYRSAPVDVREARKLPVVCGVGAVTSAVWGFLTLLVFAPAGLLLFAISSDNGSAQPLVTVGAIGVLVASGHGFLLGTRLIGLVKALVVRTESSAMRVGRAVMVSGIHHAVVVLSFVALTASGHEGPLLLAAVPCAIGFIHVALLAQARAVLARLDREDRLRAIAASA